MPISQAFKRPISAAAIAAALIGCSGPKPESTLLDSVPADAQIIVSIDLDGTLKMAGCVSRDGRIAISEPLLRLCEKTLSQADIELLQTAAAYGDIADLKNAYIFKNQGAESIIIAAPKRESFKSDDDDFVLPAMVAEVDNCLWFMTDPAAADSISAAGKTSPASRCKLVCDALDTNGKIAAIYRFPKPMANPAGQDFDGLACTMALTDRNLTFSAKGICGQEFVDVLSKLPAIADSVSLLMPASPAAWAEVALNRPSIDAIAAHFNSLPLGNRLALNMIMSAISPDGGTFGAALLPGGNAETIRNFSLSTWDACAFVPVTPAAAAALSLAGKIVPMGIYSDVSDGYLTLCTWDAWGDESEEMDNAFYFRPEPGQVFAAQVNMPYGSELMKAFGLKAGYSVNVSAREGLLEASVGLLGPAPYIAPALISDLLTVIP